MASIMVDLDDTVFPFVDTLRRYLRETDPESCLSDPTSWNLEQEWGFEPGELWEKAATYVEGGLLYDADPIEGALEGLTMLAADHTIHICTARLLLGRPSAVQYDTVSWLTDHQIPHDSITYVGHDKTILRCDYGIDDRPENCHELAKLGTRMVLQQRPWNLDAFGLPVVTNLVEFAEGVAACEKERAA